MENNIDVVVIGGGPGGYVAAIRCGQLHLNTVLIEKNKIGGVCLNRGCIPSKALLHAAKIISNLKSANKIGIDIKGHELNWEKLKTWKNGIVQRLTKGIEFLINKNGVKIIKGEVIKIEPQKVIYLEQGEEKVINTKNIIVATGSREVHFPGFPQLNGTQIVSAPQLIENMPYLPQHLIIIGGGVIGIEIATMFSHFGSSVSIIELMPQILPGIPIDMVKIVEKGLRTNGVEIYTNSKLTDTEINGNIITAKFENEGVVKSITGDQLLISVGMKPNLDLFSNLNVVDEKGRLKVNSGKVLPGIWAIGDITGLPMLAHKASYEGEQVAEIIAGKRDNIASTSIPGVVYSFPEIAVVGISEQEAEQKNIEITKGKFPFSASGRAQTEVETEGFVKIIAEKQTDKIIGGQIVGPNASELITQISIAIQLGIKSKDFSIVMRPHPTLSEAVMESSKNISGEAVHILNNQ